MASGQAKNRKAGFYFYTVVAIWDYFRHHVQLYLHGIFTDMAKAKPRTLTGQLFIDFGDFVDLLLFAILCMWNFMVKFLFMISIIGTSS